MTAVFSFARMLAQNLNERDSMNKGHWLTKIASLIGLTISLPIEARDLVVVYPAYSEGATTSIEGRVTEAEDVSTPTTNDGRRTNLSRALELLSNDERKGVDVTVQVTGREWRTKTDNEGYFRVVIPDLSAAPGWHAVTAQSGEASGESRLLVAQPKNVHGIVSDVDDTIQVTEVNDKSRMLANTLLQNPLQRQSVPGAADFYRELAGVNPAPDATPIFYLSASPRQLHDPLELFLKHHNFPTGVLITKRVTNDATSEPLSDQFAYKTAKLEEIFTRLTNVRFTLIGDDGEKDPEIFQALRERFPDRVSAIWIRRVNPDPQRVRLPNQGDLNERLAEKKTPR
jgi:phosphatidate phosphatase APP1